MRKTLKEIASYVEGEVIGDQGLVITGISGIEEAGEGDITFVANPKYIPMIEKTCASAVITSRDVKKASKPIIRTDNPSLAFAKVISLVKPTKKIHPQGVDPSAVLGKDVALGENVAIGAHTVIADKVSIGDNSVIYAGCFIGEATRIGSNTLIHANVSIREETTIGSNVVIDSGTVIGSDGFGFITIEGKHQRIPQVGVVIIEDDVEIGSNVCIDRARFDRTVIGRGTKIDNLVHIAHNVIIGPDSLVVAQVGISGSTKIGKGVTLAGQAGLVGHISVGDNAIVMAQSGVNKSIPAETAVWGYPAKAVNIARRVNACVQNLPRLFQTVTGLKKKIEELEKIIKNQIDNPKKN
ncbi:MAG: UDP-3-O-(3-hydroxymyristoyl)glucosamine N-acyltransferase [Candidatus Omnitrophota bacterium]|nr:MAG: UDP-3-O-(3-hydroxymyristoyl)glucosamine N-acyltransferase [Candidatus Omnitrophota bacterium]